MRRVLVPRGVDGCPEELQRCVVTAADDGSVALVCVASGRVRAAADGELGAALWMDGA